MIHFKYDYSKLLGRMREKAVTQSILAREIGVSEPTINAKLGDKIAFKQDEIVSICKVLDINIVDVVPYFFTNRL